MVVVKWKRKKLRLLIVMATATVKLSSSVLAFTYAIATNKSTGWDPMA
jgi:hypothetical protein